MPADCERHGPLGKVGYFDSKHQRGGPDGIGLLDPIIEWERGCITLAAELVARMVGLNECCSAAGMTREHETSVPGSAMLTHRILCSFNNDASALGGSNNWKHYDF